MVVGQLFFESCGAHFTTVPRTELLCVNRLSPSYLSEHSVLKTYEMRVAAVAVALRGNRCSSGSRGRRRRRLAVSYTFF